MASRARAVATRNGLVSAGKQALRRPEITGGYFGYPPAIKVAQNPTVAPGRGIVSDIESSAGRSPASRGTDSVSADLDPPHPAVDLDGSPWELPQVRRRRGGGGRDTGAVPRWDLGAEEVDRDRAIMGPRV